MSPRNRRDEARAVPVLMLHSVAPPVELAPHRWLQRLATPPELLEASFEGWRRAGYRTVGLDELEGFVLGRARLPRGSLVITLDDGYLDNWVALNPLLRHFDFRATVFMSTDFVDPRPITRPQRGGTAGASPLVWKGYLSWDEMRSMERDGSVDIQSHAKTHTWHFVSDRIVDYYGPVNALTRPRSRLRFLWLNAHPERKPFALGEMEDTAIPWGTPVYEYRPALVARRFVPDPAEAEALIEFVASRGGAAFFGQGNWKDLLDSLVRKHRSGRRSTGDFEGEEERVRRVREELVESRRRLSEGLGKDVTVLSFPQGGMEEPLVGLAREAGYRMWTMPSRVGRHLNRPGGDPSRIYRIGSGYGFFGDGASARMQVLSQRIVLARYSGSTWARLATGAMTLARRTALGSRAEAFLD